MHHENTVVITSIYPPSQAVKDFARLPNWRCIVIGDRKSPSDWAHPEVDYYSLESQLQLPYKLATLLPTDHYARKNLGYLLVASRGARYVLDTDDDNLPYPNWSHPAFEGTFACTRINEGFVNTYSHFTNQFIWPRGLPLQEIHRKQDWREHLQLKPARIGIWQGLADGDPDVDAIYRLTRGEPCTFDDAPPVVLDVGTCCPFNSQNTVIRHELFALLYLPSHVSFRFTDILRGLIAQPLMWRHGYRLGFSKANVVQERNPHDYFVDFKQELPCYLHTHEIIEKVDAAISRSASLSEQLYLAYEALIAPGIVRAEEMSLLQAWLDDLYDVGCAQ